MKLFKLLLLFLFIVNSSQAQSLKGSYQEANGTRTLTFNNGKFTDTLFSGDMGIKEVGEGTYSIANKKLILTYLPVLNKDSSFYIINSVEGTTPSGQVNLQVTDEGGTPMQAFVGLDDNAHRPQIRVFTDKAGKSYLTIHPASAYLVVAYIGYYSVAIPANRLLAKKTELVVKLKPQDKTYTRPKKEVYELAVPDAKTIWLTTPGKGRLVLGKLE